MKIRDWIIFKHFKLISHIFYQIFRKLTMICSLIYSVSYQYKVALFLCNTKNLLSAVETLNVLLASNPITAVAKG